MKHIEYPLKSRRIAIPRLISDSVVIEYDYNHKFDNKDKNMTPEGIMSFVERIKIDGKPLNIMPISANVVDRYIHNRSGVRLSSLLQVKN